MDNQEQLYEASIIALRDYLGVMPEETLLVITDENKHPIGRAIFEAGKKLCYEAFMVEMKSREIDGEEPPETIADMMKAVDVVVCPTTHSLTHTDARRSASKVGVRVATMPGITEESMIRCINPEYERIINTSERIFNKLKGGSTVRVVSEMGTDITFSMKERRIFVNTGIIKNIGESGNLPGGEVYLSPVEGSAEGTIVFDGSFGNIGLLEENVKITIKDGYAIRFGGKSDAKKISAVLKKVSDDALQIAEFGIGTNHTAMVCGNIIEDEKALGTIHFGFGNNVAMGGKINVPIHLDGIVRSPTVFVDGQVLMLLGHLLT